RDPALLVDHLLRVRLGARHLVRVVERHQLELASVDAAGVVHLLEVGERAVADVVAELGVGAAQRRRLADDDAARADARGLRLRGTRADCDDAGDERNRSDASRHTYALRIRLSVALDLSQGSRYPDSPTIRPFSANERDDHAVG